MKRRIITLMDLAKLVAQIHCPWCGERGYPLIAAGGPPGTMVVLPRYQCDTPDCPYNRNRNNTWTNASSN
jgi:hypothetical protein